MNGECNYTVTAAVETGTTAAGTTFVLIEILAFIAGLRVRTTRQLRDLTVPEGVKVLDSQHIDDVFLHWEELDNVELLADVFKAQRVDVFKQIVTSLGRLHGMQDAVKGLMAEA
jgi:hypothetical protein